VVLFINLLEHNLVLYGYAILGDSSLELKILAYRSTDMLEHVYLKEVNNGNDSGGVR
jgi:hypothetical protein